MILFLAGTPGIGKTTLAQTIAEARPRTLVLSIDDIRTSFGVTVTTNSMAEDAVNWQVFTRATGALTEKLADLVIIDSTGISRRMPYLRYALGEFEQQMAVLTSAFGYALCARKWASAYSQEEFRYFSERVDKIQYDYQIPVDGKTPQELSKFVMGTVAIAGLARIDLLVTENVMQSFPIQTVSEYQIVAHYTCPGELNGNQGAYEIFLNALQADELNKNGYTLTTDTCQLCWEESTFMLRLWRSIESKPA